ncbi:carbohydrate ABC transporter permease [Ktedonospora formicarum]|uniref:Sugar ABC transporter permease n=1 Tax=Ktedonospora formicarum TaxID=2778364 RepID=A0A8J3MSE1_9CHLR|nr:carbohydrate ABC transporter permease [Ktedonospora formicarum]GHO46015.1 sugar ABC transporter permease [Ktedonospora formicarum]
MEKSVFSGAKRPAEYSMLGKFRQALPSAIAYILLFGYALLSVYPFLWMVSSSIKSNREVLTSQSLIPTQIRFDILIQVWNELNFWKYFVNSAVITLMVIAGVVIIYSLAGYGFAKTNFWGREVFFLGFLALLLVPGVSVLIPLAKILVALGLTGRDATQFSTYVGVTMPMINGAGPLTILLFRNYFSRLPQELHDAALIDGCGEFGIYWRIFLPLSLPVIATIGILNFVATWNSYIWPSIVINNADWYTLPLKLKDLDLQTVIQWNVRMAGSLITTIPIIVVFLFLQRYYIRGITGAVKG